MSEIPEDIREVAFDIMDEACLGDPWVKTGVDYAIRMSIARALLAERMAEREACAKIAEETTREVCRDASMYVLSGPRGIGMHIAAAIRNQEKP
jgi:hypothetical protein